MNTTTTECYNQDFTIRYEYPVYFSKNIFSYENELLASVIKRYNEDRIHRLIIFIDDGVVKAFPDLIENIREYFKGRSEKFSLIEEIVILPGGEKSKGNWDSAQKTIEKITEHHICRQSFVIAIGGGSILDIVGFAASLVHRGVRLIRIPTTVLSQNDAGIGVKNGVDGYGVKNLTGTFAPPFAVLNDYSFLKTLEPDYWLGGASEAFKVAIIKDRDFFAFLSEKASALKNRDETVMEEVIKRCAILHLDHIRTSGDPFEFGSARPLDFGHWSGHKLEALSGYKIGHGQGVSLGIALDTRYAFLAGLLSEQESFKIIDALYCSGLPIWTDLFEAINGDGEFEIIKGINDFREHLGGQLTITLPDGIGARVEVHEMNLDLVKQAVADLKMIFKRKRAQSE